ncbi:MAG TPA: 5'/3'-nucleotidase SurE [Candidatus Acidoferrales bacterium]|nr:5'/3'-nucleotidase SurE [Candidatus Acidoferrales bacterium]
MKKTSPNDSSTPPNQPGSPGTASPRILITNDDGIQAPGLRALVEGLQDISLLTVVAPSHERSASAQSLTLRQPIYCDQIAEREYAVEGTPADAVILAFNMLLKEKPDLVISGINRGGNVGENVYYSGTIGAAMEGALNRVPSIAISLAYKGKDVDFNPAVKFARVLAPLVLKEGLPAGVLLNVNVPQPWNGSVRFVRQSSKITRNVLEPGKDSRGRSYYWLREQQVIEGIDPDTDQAAIREGAISVTPLVIDHTHAASLNHLSHWKKLLESASQE